jgi:hypothetical protein
MHAPLSQSADLQIIAATRFPPKINIFALRNLTISYWLTEDNGGVPNL